MALPQQVINQLSQERTESPGGSFGIISFAAILLIVMFGLYAFLAFVYGPYLNHSLDGVENNLATLDQSVASGDQDQLMTFYSQAVNLQTVLKNHIVFSQLLDWLSNNTEANVSYSQFSFSSGSQITLTGVAKSPADVNQQIAIFEASPVVKKAAVSNLAVSPTDGSWAFTATIVVNSSLLMTTTTAATASTVSPSPPISPSAQASTTATTTKP